MTLPKAESSSIGSKITTMCSIIGVISIILLIVVVMPQNNERSKELDQKLVDTVLHLLDTCVNTKTLAVIVSCDKEIDNGKISNICKDNNIKECDSKIVEYHANRDTFCEQLRYRESRIFIEFGLGSDEHYYFIMNNQDDLSYCRK